MKRSRKENLQNNFGFMALTGSKDFSPSDRAPSATFNVDNVQTTRSPWVLGINDSSFYG